nr:hypothetical protein [Tanacetum cinerariifolium]
MLELVEEIMGEFLRLSKAGINLDNEENDFLLTEVLEDELEELNASCIMVAWIYDDHEQTYHERQESIKPSYDNDQIDSSIIVDDSDREGNSEIIENDTITHGQHRAEMETLMKSV